MSSRAQMSSFQSRSVPFPFEGEINGADGWLLLGPRGRQRWNRRQWMWANPQGGRASASPTWVLNPSTLPQTLHHGAPTDKPTILSPSSLSPIQSKMESFLRTSQHLELCSFRSRNPHLPCPLVSGTLANHCFLKASLRSPSITHNAPCRVLPSASAEGL